MPKNGKLDRGDVIAAYMNAFGKRPSKAFVAYWAGKQDSVLRDKLRANPNAQGVYADYRGQNNVSIDTPTTPLAPAPLPDYYSQFAQSAQGQQLAGQYSPEYLSATIDPYYNQQQGGEDYLKQVSQEQLGRNIDVTQRNYGQNFNDRGIYGSGIYQQALGEELGNLNRTFEQQYGAGQYTPFSQRKAAIEEQRRIAKAQATQQGQTAYSTAYQDYLQGLSPA